MFGKDAEKAIFEMMMKKDKYRLNCRYCVRVSNSPIEVAFCKHGCGESEVRAVVGCQDCGTFEEMPK